MPKELQVARGRAEALRVRHQEVDGGQEAGRETHIGGGQLQPGSRPVPGGLQALCIFGRAVRVRRADRPETSSGTQTLIAAIPQESTFRQAVARVHWFRAKEMQAVELAAAKE